MITLPELSDRESEVLAELALGRSNIEIAAALHLSPGTIKGYLSSIMAKWDARDRVQVLVLAARAGLISFAV
jgi:DNA-binding NarL/FixJ family response regulator